MVAGVVLAAGLSRRMGQPKLLLALEGKPVLRHAVDGALAGRVEEIIVVVPPEPAALEAALAGLTVRFVINPSPEAGQGSSIAAGIAALSKGTQAALICLGDQPRVAPEVIPGLIASFRRAGPAIVAPRYRGSQGNPVLFGPQVFPELQALTGDRGARSVIERVSSRVAWVDFDLPMPEDVDTPEDYERLRAADEAV